MYEYTGNEITASYFNKVVYNTYLTDKERHLINALDYMRYETMKHEKEDYSHISWTTTPAQDFECTNLYLRFYMMIMQCMEHASELYADDNKDKPEHVIDDLKESLKGITPKQYYYEAVAYNAIDKRGNPYNNNKNTVEAEIISGDFTYIKDHLGHICRPMILALEKGEHAEYLKKAQSMIKRKTTTIGNYIIKAATK